MMQQLCATTEREQRPVARPVAVTALAARHTDLSATGMFGFDTGMATTTPCAWNVKPSVHTSAICTNGKYHTRRLQEMPT